MPTDVLEVTTNFMRNPIRILVKKEELTLEGIKQFYVLVEKEASKQFILIALCTMKLCTEKVSCFISSFDSKSKSRSKYFYMGNIQRTSHQLWNIEMIIKTNTVNKTNKNYN